MSTTRNTLIGTALVAALAITLPAASLMAKGGFGGPRGAAIEFEDLDLNGDGQLTKEELQNQHKARFAKADTNGDGELSTSELEAMASERHKKMASRIIEKLDTDGNGALSEAEMQATKEKGRVGKRGGKNEARHERLFDHADENGDGVVTKAEFDAIKDKMMKRRSAKADK